MIRRGAPLFTICPAELRPRSEEEKHALDFAEGRDPLWDVDARGAALVAVVLLLVFVLAALLRGGSPPSPSSGAPREARIHARSESQIVGPGAEAATRA